MYHIPGDHAGSAHDRGSRLRRTSPSARFRLWRERAAHRLRESQLAPRATRVDFVMLGCPHNSIDQVWSDRVAPRRPQDQRQHRALGAYPARHPRQSPTATATADDHGRRRRDRHERHLPRDLAAMPKGTKVVATDSAKQAHYLPAITGVSGLVRLGRGLRRGGDERPLERRLAMSDRRRRQKRQSCCAAARSSAAAPKARRS